MADAWGGSWGSAWGGSWGRSVVVDEPATRSGTGGWGAGLKGPRRRRDYSLPIPLSRRDQKLSDLDAPKIVKTAVTTPATVLRPLIDDDEEELMMVLLLQ